jgi:hypothetical protein
MNFKLFTAGAFTAIAVTVASAQTSVSVHTGGRGAQEINLRNGQLYVDQGLIHKGFSVSQDHFRYLYFYVPARGLFTVSNREFDGAAQSGTFEGNTLSFSVSGIDVKLESSSQILREGASPAWVKFDSEFKLDLKSVMFGYGDKEKAPYAWPDQIKKNRD